MSKEGKKATGGSAFAALRSPDAQVSSPPAGADQGTSVTGDNPDIQKFIKKNYVPLSKMEVDDVVGYLYQDDVVTFDEMTRILSTENPARQLLQLLSVKKSCSPEQVTNALRFAHQTEIVDNLNYGGEMALNVQWPKAPDKLEHVTTTKSSIKLRWTKVDDSETLLGYLVEQSHSGEDDWKSAHEGVSMIPKTNETQLAVPGYKTYQEYDFRVKAVHYINGQRVFTVPRLLQGLVAKLPGQPHPPRDLKVESCHNGSNYVTLSWAEPVIKEVNTTISYIVQKGLVQHESIEWGNCKTTEDCECRLHDELRVGESYCFRVFAQDEETRIESEATVLKGSEIRIKVDLKEPHSGYCMLSSAHVPEDILQKLQKVTLVANEKGSVILVFSCDDLHDLIELRKMYHQGEVHKVLQEIFVSEDLRASGVSPDDLTVYIKPEDFTASCRHLLLTHPTDKGCRAVRIGAAHSKGQIQLGRSQEYPVYTKPRQSKENPYLEGLDLETSTHRYQPTREEETAVSHVVMDHENPTSLPSCDRDAEVPDTTENKKKEVQAGYIQDDGRSDIPQDQQSLELPRMVAVPDKSNTSLADKLQKLKLPFTKATDPEQSYGQALRDAIVYMDPFVEAEVLKSLGDLHLQKAMLRKDSAEFDKAAGLYAAALLRCKDPDMVETLEHRIGYMEKLSRKLLQGYSPHSWGPADSNVLRVAEICNKLDRSNQKSLQSIEDSYTHKLVTAITNGDKLLEQELLKSLGDLYLQKGKKTSDVSQFSKAATMYGKALTACVMPDGEQTLHHRILYTVKVHVSIKQQLSQRTKQNKKRKKKRKVVTRHYSSQLYKKHLRQGDLALQRADLDSAEQHFADALKLVHVRDPTIGQYQGELEPLQKLGDVYSKRGQQRRDGGDFVKAAALYNAALARSSGEVMQGVIRTAITEVEMSFVRHVLNIECIDHKSKQLSELHKKQLNLMRYQVKLEMETIDQQLDPYVYDENDICVKEIESKRAQAVRQLFENIAKQRKEFISLLVEECIGLMGPPTCRYALIGLGSQATGLVTPYSDLEFAILVENESAECLVYFCNLTHYLHLKVVNLGETILPALGIRSLNDFYSENPLDNWYYDSVTPRGLAFDTMPGASKTPLGRHKSRGLIQTPSNMVTTLKNDATVYLREAYHLASTLRNPPLLIGDQVLVESYVATVVSLLKAEEGKIALQLTRDILQDNMEDYNRQALTTTKLFDIKKEIYGLPSLAVDCCALCSHVLPSSVWKTIDDMEATKIISADNAHHLRVLVSISAELRLRTYIANKGQKEMISALSTLKTQDTSLQNILYITNIKQFHRYYYTALPLKKALTTLYPPTGPLELPLLFDNSLAAKQTMNFDLLGNYKEAVHLMEKELRNYREIHGESIEDPYIARLLHDLGSGWSSLGYSTRAVIYLEQALQMFEYIHGDGTANPGISRTLNSLGSAWDQLGDYKKAINYYEQALEMNRRFWGEKAHPDTATTLNNLGLAWEHLGNYRRAINYHEEALQTYRTIHGQGASHPDIARILDNLGSVHQYLGHCREAIHYLEQALQMYTIIYGQSTVHPDIARSLTILGSAWGQLGDHRKTVSYYERSLQMMRVIFGENTPRPDIASSLNNLGTAWSRLGDNRKAVSYHVQALQMYKIIHGESTVNRETARSLDSLGSAWHNLGDYRKAACYFEEALQMYTIIYGQSTAHPELASLLHKLGSTWNQVGDVKKAISYYDKSLQMMKSIYGQTSPHPDIASSLNNLGATWSRLGDNKKAVSYYKQSLQMKMLIYGKNHEHPDIAMSLNNLGSALEEIGDYKGALDHYEQALHMYHHIYGPNNAHPDIARSLNRLGSVWVELGDYRKAIRYYEQALQMHKGIYGDSTPHPNIATSLHNLGLAWMHLGDYTKAISYHTRSLGMYTRIYGKDHTHSDIPNKVLNSLGVAYFQLGDFETAISYYEQYLQMKRHTSDPDIASCLNNMGSAWAKLGNFKKAVSYHEQSLQMNEKIYGSDHPDVAKALNNAGLACTKLGDFNKAVNYYNESLEMMRRIYGDDKAHPQIAALLNNLGSVYGEQGDYRRAIDYHEMSLEMRRSIYGDSKAHRDIASSLNNLGSVWLKLGDYGKAVSYLEQALEMCSSIFGESAAHPDMISSLVSLGLVWAYEGDKNKAKSYFEQVLQIQNSTYGGNTSYSDIASSLSSMDYKKAVRYFEKLHNMKFP